MNTELGVALKTAAMRSYSIKADYNIAMLIQLDCRGVVLRFKWKGGESSTILTWYELENLTEPLGALNDRIDRDILAITETEKTLYGQGIGRTNDKAAPYHSRPDVPIYERGAGFDSLGDV